jgi:hypothetical protein
MALNYKANLRKKIIGIFFSGSATAYQLLKTCPFRTFRIFLRPRDRLVSKKNQLRCDTKFAQKLTKLGGCGRHESI